MVCRLCRKVRARTVVLMLDKTLFDQLYRYCYSLTADPDNACDLLQTAFEKYLNTGRTLIEINKFYMMKVIRNQWIDDVRRSGRVRVEPFDEENYLDFDVATLEQTVTDQDTIAVLWAGFAPVEREILFLWAVEGYTTTEIADWLNLRRGTVLSRISRLRKRVQEQTGEKNASAG